MFAITILCSLLFASLARGQVQDVCLSMRSEQGAVTPPTLTQGPPIQGRPGKRGSDGATGPPGPQGEKGSRGACGCSLSEVNELRAQLQRLQKEMCTSGIVYNGACIKLHYTRGIGVDYDEAVRLCGIGNGTLAEVISDRMFDAIFQTIGNYWVEYSDRDVDYVDVWLGSTYQHGNGILKKSGDKITLSSKKWYPNYPKSKEGFSNLLIEWRRPPAHHGIFNYEPSYNLGIPLCQYMLTE